MAATDDTKIRDLKGTGRTNHDLRLRVIDTIEHHAMNMDIQINRAAEVLNKRHGAALSLPDSAVIAGPAAKEAAGYGEMSEADFKRPLRDKGSPDSGSGAVKTCCSQLPPGQSITRILWASDR